MRVLSRRACKSDRWNQCQFKIFACFDSIPNNHRQAVNQLGNNFVKRTEASNDLLTTTKKPQFVQSLHRLFPHISRFVSLTNLPQWQMQKLHTKRAAHSEYLNRNHVQRATAWMFNFVLLNEFNWIYLPFVWFTFFDSCYFRKLCENLIIWWKCQLNCFGRLEASELVRHSSFSNGPLLRCRFEDMWYDNNHRQHDATQTEANSLQIALLIWVNRAHTKTTTSIHLLNGC